MRTMAGTVIGRRPRMWRRLLVAVLTGCLGVLISAAGFIMVRTHEQDHLRTDFARYAKDSLSVLKGRIHEDLLVLNLRGPVVSDINLLGRHLPGYFDKGFEIQMAGSEIRAAVGDCALVCYGGLGLQALPQLGGYFRVIKAGFFEHFLEGCPGVPAGENVRGLLGSLRAGQAKDLHGGAPGIAGFEEFQEEGSVGFGQR